MEIGEKILELRKKNNLSQEELAEKVGVARQTISKWELGETSPDIKQAKELSKIFKVSLDELVNNDIKNILEEKVSNTEKLAGIIIKILKFMGIAFIVMLVIDVLALAFFTIFRQSVISSVVDEVSISCAIDDEDYLITISSDGHFNCSNCDIDLQRSLKALVDYSNIDESINMINNYFEDNDGKCE